MTSPSSAEVEAPAAEQEWLRLDRRTIFVAPLQPLGGLLLTGLLIVTFRGWDQMGLVEPLIGLAVAVGAFVLSAWYWATTRYRITPTHVELRSGLLVRNHRSVARDRLRSVDITADVLHRAAGLAVVAVGTGRQGGQADDELKLEALSRADAEALRSFLLRRERTPAPEPALATAPVPPPDEPIAVFDPAWVLLAPLSLMGLVAVAVVGGAAAQLLRGAFGDEVWSSAPVLAVFDWVVATSPLITVVGGIVVLLIANALLSPVLYVLAYGGYRLVRHDGSLRVTYGLVTHRSVTIEERRIRGVRMAEPLLLRLAHGARLSVVAAGLGVTDKEGKDKRNSDLLLPVAPAAVAHGVTEAVLGARPSPLRAPLRRHPPAALRVLMIQWSVLAVPALVLGVLALLDIVPDWTWEAALLLAAAGVVGAVLEYRNLGHARVGGYLVARGGAVVRHTTAVRCDGIIAWQFRRTLFQRRSRLLTATAAVAAGRGTHVIGYASQDDVLPVAADAVPGLLTPFLEPDPTSCGRGSADAQGLRIAPIR